MMREKNVKYWEKIKISAVYFKLSFLKTSSQ